MPDPKVEIPPQMVDQEMPEVANESPRNEEARGRAAEDALPPQGKPLEEAQRPTSDDALDRGGDPRSALERQPYEFERCTVQIAIQLLPSDGDAQGRPVLLGVRTHLDAPLVRMVRASELGELPPPLTALVEQLKSELPAREQAARERQEKEKTARARRHTQPSPPIEAKKVKAEKAAKGKTVQAASAPAQSVLTEEQRQNAVSQATVDDKQQLALF